MQGLILELLSKGQVLPALLLYRIAGPAVDRERRLSKSLIERMKWWARSGGHDGRRR